MGFCVSPTILSCMRILGRQLSVLQQILLKAMLQNILQGIKPFE